MKPTSWIKNPIIELDEGRFQLERKRQDALSKPVGSLGLLEEIAIRLAVMQKTSTPSLLRTHISLFAADHGIATKVIVSAFPQYTTEHRVKSILTGNSAINVLARQLGADWEVIDTGLANNPGTLPKLIQQRAGAGTNDFRTTMAMDDQQLSIALRAGKDAVARAFACRAKLFIGGNLGIGNTSSATAITCALLGTPPESITGPGCSGVPPEIMAKKAQWIHEALEFHQHQLTDPMRVLMHVGGFEIAALCGAYIAAGQMGIPVVIDGYAASAAALVAVSIKPRLLPWLFFGQRSPEPGQTAILRALRVAPILDLGMRLEEGTGAIACVPILRMACALHAEMNTRQEDGYPQELA